MTPKQIQEGLQELRRSFEPILHDSARHVLAEAVAGLSPFLGPRRFRRLGPVSQKWGYRINPDNPLRFRSVMVDELGVPLWVDVYCVVEWDKDNAPPITQEIKIRAWSNHHEFLHDFELQAIDKPTPELVPCVQDVIDRMTGDGQTGRVIYRCHFDKANNAQSGPKYHVQFGGAPRSNECGWIPQVIDLPRIVQPPLDLILTCELIAMNFYPRAYLEIRRNPTWQAVVYESQKNVLKEYYENCGEQLRRFDIDEAGSLLEHLWNIPLD